MKFAAAKFFFFVCVSWLNDVFCFQFHEKFSEFLSSSVTDVHNSTNVHSGSRHCDEILFLAAECSGLSSP